MGLKAELLIPSPVVYHSEASNSFVGPSATEIYYFLITFNENVEQPCDINAKIARVDLDAI